MNNFLDTLAAFISNPFFFILFTLIIVLLLIFISYKFGSVSTRLEMRDEIRRLQEESVKRSKAVTAGLMGEQIAPFLPNFPCNPADVRFVGKPIDFVAFPGAAKGDEISEVLFIEVKTGSSKLSEREKQIKSAVESGRVRYIVYHAL
ncbi:MAG: Holliday junction resolvase [Treponema sp.]|nr:Holliday junction resolvase [Treponema sp.]